MKSCLIFDLDRTLVDSKKVTQKILEIFLDKYNIESKGMDDKKGGDNENRNHQPGPAQSIWGTI